MRLFWNELKYSAIPMLMFATMLIIFVVSLTPRENIGNTIRMYPIFFTLGLAIYNLLYRSNEKNERFLVTLPVNIRLIPLLRYFTLVIFWIYSQVLYFTVAANLNLIPAGIEEILISIKIFFIMVTLISVAFVLIDKFNQEGIKGGIKKTYPIFLIVILSLFIVFYSLLPLNVINAIYLDQFLTIKYTVENFWKNDVSLFIIMICGLFSVIINIELFVRKKLYTN